MGLWLAFLGPQPMPATQKVGASIAATVTTPADLRAAPWTCRASAWITNPNPPHKLAAANKCLAQSSKSADAANAIRTAKGADKYNSSSAVSQQPEGQRALKWRLQVKKFIIACVAVAAFAAPAFAAQPTARSCSRRRRITRTTETLVGQDLRGSSRTVSLCPATAVAELTEASTPGSTGRRCRSPADEVHYRVRGSSRVCCSGARRSARRRVRVQGQHGLHQDRELSWSVFGADHPERSVCVWQLRLRN